MKRYNIQGYIAPDCMCESFMEEDGEGKYVRHDEASDLIRELVGALRQCHVYAPSDSLAYQEANEALEKVDEVL